jgi:hypothetical protein
MHQAGDLHSLSYHDTHSLDRLDKVFFKKKSEIVSSSLCLVTSQVTNIKFNGFLLT